MNLLFYTVLGVIISVAIGVFVYLKLRADKKKQIYNEQFDFTTKHGIRVHLSSQTRNIKQEAFEDWTEKLVDFWEKKMNCDRDESLKHLSKTSVLIYDQVYLERFGVKVNGILHPARYEIEIATIPPEKDKDKKYINTPYKRTKSLFKHEASHIIVGYVGGFKMDNDIHHDIFRGVKLGA